VVLLNDFHTIALWPAKIEKLSKYSNISIYQ
jgi:hypothetical protein